jgi:hypothetical protein
VLYIDAYITPARVFLGLLVPGEGPRCHKILHHEVVLELVVDRVHMVWAGLLEKFPEVVCQGPCLVLAIACSGSNLLHVGCARFLVIIVVVVGPGQNPLRVPLSPLLSALGVLDGDIGWCRFVAAGDCFCAT